MTQPAGTVIIVSSLGFVSGAIRLATRSHWSHVAIADGQGGIVEALGRGIVRSPETKYDHVEHVWLRHAPLPNPANAVNYAESRIGKPYNYPAIAVLGIESLGVDADRLARWADRRDADICSELAVLSWRAGGYDPWPHYIACTVSPAMFANRALIEDWA